MLFFLFFLTQRCLVAYEENKQPEWLQLPLVLKDALSDLPAVSISLSKTFLHRRGAERVIRNHMQWFFG